jgi:hypothetical protein
VGEVQGFVYLDYCVEADAASLARDTHDGSVISIENPNSPNLKP